MKAVAGAPKTHHAASFWLVVPVIILAVQILAEHFMGRIWICSCGYVKLFEAGVNTSGNSQHLADWYTPSHIIHGFLFYGLGWLVLRRGSFGQRLTLATLIEAGWELLENSPIIINRYRAATMAVGYEGDSILNSAMDTVFMALGFLFAARVPVWLTIVVAVFFELLTGYLIRDNLTLNVIMLVWPVDAIKAWQAAL
ncbi:DUF2585 family protein [Agrobacterium vitis]|uniref:DUF2585 domain-containing protein n=1 Tax=Rhizobium/Agrobacterium group TaxID=227290 RepID=UPI0009BED00B|nr:DUF2585 domain-containing protein [Agrobacterium vitis]MCF1436053.1 DUF2585 domain-containing protein [Allorhizobium ampelinum]MUO89167.1 DUF2585 family protein [Agrobacterium vitis]MUZ52638.1 DUF2585 family protein [Agrobacterium vitis]MUZ92175.1 DUF2585 family protein [Agrobacterium vitis]MVA41747.1 DUF2585 family protein [Agrobacterium vitis]